MVPPFAITTERAGQRSSEAAWANALILTWIRKKCRLRQAHWTEKAAEKSAGGHSVCLGFRLTECLPVVAAAIG